MQRWKCAVGAIVLIAVAGGSVAGCSKSGNAKQNAAQAKAKPKADPKAAKADPKAAAKPDPKAAAAKADPKAAAAKPDPKAAKPAQTATNTPKTTAPAQPAAAATKPATPAPAQKTAPPAANTKTTTPAPVNAAATKPATTSVPAPPKPALASPAPAATTAASGDVQQTLQTNKTLTAQLQSRLPAGTDVVKASMGFRNLTQFVSAVHACQNLSIPFDKMRTAMVDEKKSLSAAIRALKPTASATIEAQRADYDARGTIYQAQQPETPAADSPAKKAKATTAPGVERQ